jgi:hypothetical protein
MSALSDTLIIAVGSGGAVSTLTAALRAWLATRGRRAVIRIESGDRSIVIDAANIKSEDLARILQDITRDIQERPSGSAAD